MERLEHVEPPRLYPVLSVLSVVDRQAEGAGDRNAWAMPLGEAGKDDLRMSAILGKPALLFDLVCHLRSKARFRQVHNVIECCPADQGGDWHHDVERVREGADDAFGSAAENRHWHFRDGHHFVHDRHQPPFGRVHGAVAGDLDAVLPDKGNKRAHAASSFFSSSFGG